jgi:hypothetical protein
VRQHSYPRAHCQHPLVRILDGLVPKFAEEDAVDPARSQDAQVVNPAKCRSCVLVWKQGQERRDTEGKYIIHYGRPTYGSRAHSVSRYSMPTVLSLHNMCSHVGAACYDEKTR